MENTDGCYSLNRRLTIIVIDGYLQTVSESKACSFSDAQSEIE